MSDTNYLITFKAISNFTKDLAEIFASRQHSLKLYSHLINKTTLGHDKAIKKHINAFREFCITNRDAIFAKDKTKLVTQNNKNVTARIVYSKNVFIDLTNILEMADKDTQQVIWKHLLVISAFVDPAGKAKEILKQKSSGKETDFLTDIISKVEEHVDPNSNPMEAVSSIMKSGVFTDILSGMNNGMQDGSLDLGKLMSSVQTMVTSLNGQTSINTSSTDSANSMNAINSMIGNLANVNTGESSSAQTAPDLSALMSMMGPMLSTLGANNNQGKL